MDDQKSGVDTFLSTVIFGSSDPLGNLNEDDDLGTYEAPDPVAERIAAIANEFKFGKLPIDPSWNEPVGLLEKREREPEPEEFSSDGIVTERNGNQVWHYTVNAGQITHMKVEDEDVPGGVLHFDGDGNEIAA